MVNIAVFASGNGSNFENIAMCIKQGTLRNVCCKVLIVDKEHAYAIQRAEQLHIPWIYVNPKAYADKRGYEQRILEKLKEYAIDLIVLAGYMRFIGEVLLTSYPRRIINLHPAYLPHFLGAHSIQDAFEAKVSFTGVTVHYVDEGVDTGEIIHQEKIFIDPAWTLETLEEHVHALEYRMFPEVIRMVSDEIEKEGQSYETSIGKCI